MCVFAILFKSTNLKFMFLFGIILLFGISNIKAFISTTSVKEISKALKLDMLHTKMIPNRNIKASSFLNAATIETAVKTKSNEDGSANKKKKKRNGDIGAMEVVVLGLSHHNAAVDVREKLAIPEANWNDAATSLCEFDGIAEAAVLSTCNRFELYLAGSNQYECIRDAINFLQNKAGGSLDQATLRKNLFMLSGEDAIWHSLRVSAGLDSLVVGEGQILSQVKRSYEKGIEPPNESGVCGQAGKVVSRLLNTAVAAGKRVRAETGDVFYSILF